MLRTLIPEHPCSACGGENRSTSRFCRHCGHSLDDSDALVAEFCQVGYVSDAGRRYVAQENEDMLLVVQGLCGNAQLPPRPFSLLAVADGLRVPQGRSAGGHEASRLAVETIADMLIPRLTASPRSFSPAIPGTLSTIAGVSQPPARISKAVSQSSTPETPGVAEAQLEQWLRESVRQAHSVIYHCNADYDTTMASTLTVGTIYKRHFYGVNVGDSRAYHYHPGRGIRRVTSEPAQNFNLGQAKPAAVDFFQCAVAKDDLVLLCTDGLWKMLTDERLGVLLAQGSADDLQKLARTLVDAANLAGGEGNISAIVARIS